MIGMSTLRRTLGPFAATWLLCQIAGITLTPVVFWPTASASECTCAHGDHGTCPMHHQRAPNTRCALRGADHNGATVLSSLLGGIGLVPPTTVNVATVLSVTPIAGVGLDRIFTRSVSPDPPPPRV